VVTVVRLLTTHEDVRFVHDLGGEAFAPYSRDAGRSMLLAGPTTAFER
jgi:hypothetical protein